MTEEAGIGITFITAIAGISFWYDQCGKPFMACFGGGWTGAILAFIPVVTSIGAGIGLYAGLLYVYERWLK